MPRLLLLLAQTFRLHGGQTSILNRFQSNRLATKHGRKSYPRTSRIHCSQPRIRDLAEGSALTFDLKDFRPNPVPCVLPRPASLQPPGCSAQAPAKLSCAGRETKRASKRRSFAFTASTSACGGNQSCLKTLQTDFRPFLSPSGDGLELLLCLEDPSSNPSARLS